MTTTEQETHELADPVRTVYTPQDHEKLTQILRWLDVNQRSRSWLSKATAIPSGTVSQILSGKYISSPTRQLNNMLATLQVESERTQSGTPGYVEGSVHALLALVCGRTRKYRNFGVFTGFVGIGKTRFAKEYSSGKPMTLLVEVSPNMTPGVLLTELLEQLKNAVPVGLDNKFREVVRILRGTNYLLIADEAERLSPSSLEYLRRIRDMAQVGVVLIGTEKLTGLIDRKHGQFDQIRSRVGMWPKTVERISRDDADDMARAALTNTELTDEVLDALWLYCGGSARVLNEALIPAIKDYGKGESPTAHMVEVIAATVLFMEKPNPSKVTK